MNPSPSPWNLPYPHLCVYACVTYSVARHLPPYPQVASRLAWVHTVGDLESTRRRRQQQGGRTGPDAIFR